ncbi:hypothetical protein H9Q72_014429 [Fusarium xylarioides]|uniref:Uncharacterized protein n=1 Tax=Fusarium xylarioides TaxID=221167 RepID=A0A9P7IGS0_9HYPO|nr:hypothetical protein H9Q70_014374 [Fusarium xylarioides]KAG5757118.1 hypothetical protein H9Q72_014429 [Fusarium xylarioides]KAG5767461.1 hypothetical protein H9Q73_014223 [Fusarium xylarioides]KAG5802610.1 hypothetical protein H9Q71_012806 [Fusarium xylarioides]KAG5811303.1 hypothetical protein H9Q74_013623 [Fusarium xylarioides]
MSSTTHPLLVNIHDALRSKFDAGDQTLFQMQVPTQPLHRSELHYDGSDSDSTQMTKPSSVVEAEFRLTDGMLELSNIVGGPNGSKLSEKYDQVLSGLISADEEANPEQANEVLQQAREDLRSCVNRNMDDTEDIYPVNLVPSNWAKSLWEPSQQDNTGGIKSQLQDAISRRSLLKARKDALMALGDLKPLQKAADDAKVAVDTIEAEMAKRFTDPVAGYLKLYFAQACLTTQDGIEAIRGLNDTNKIELNAQLQKYQAGPLSDEQWKSLIALQLKHVQRSTDLDKAIEALTRAQVEVSQATSSDSRLEPRIISDQIASFTAEIEKYQNILRETGSQDYEETVNAFEGHASTPGWETLTIDSRASTQTKPRLNCTSSSNLAWSTNILSYSESGSTSFGAADQERTLSTENTDVKVVFSATKVAIDRPWFNTQVLGKSTDPTASVAANISAGNAEDVRKLFASGSTIDTTECQLPAWTTSFLVVQDVHITLTSHTTFQGSQVQDIGSCLSSGGSLLCFQACRSDTGRKQRAGYVINSDDKTIELRISVPQIIAWFTQLSL